MDEAGWDIADIAGNSLGGYVALRLAERGRARSVVAFAPAGGRGVEDPATQDLLVRQRGLYDTMVRIAPRAHLMVTTPERRRQATHSITVRSEHIPAALIEHQIMGIARCDGAPALIDAAAAGGWPVDASRITCPVRIAWGEADELLPWPDAAARWREALPTADWVVLEDVGHAPQLDVPLETAELILGFTGAC